VATRYHEEHVDIRECLAIIRLSALNLRYDGLESRDLSDLAAILDDPTKTDAELLDVLDGIERVHHRIRHRVTVPYEKLKGRLALQPDDLRLILANMQRYLHDLNSMVQFADLAATALREGMARGTAHRPAAGEAGPGEMEDLILHLSHRQEIARWISDEGTAASLRDRYGAKGSGLLYISYLNLPTRDGFVLPTSFARTGMHRREPARLRGEIARHLEILERDITARDSAPKRFGDRDNPLVLAVRGGSALSMPGILSTVVFVGMNDEIAKALAQDGPWRAYDSYRRFLASYAVAAWGVDLEPYGLVETAKQRHGVRYKQELPWEAMREVAEQSKHVLRSLGFGPQLEEILTDPLAQLAGAVNAVMESWSTERARRFRRIKGISDTWSSAVIVQEMAFGNRVNDVVAPGMDETRASLTGVITRTYVTDAGTRAFEGEIKFSAAGDDLVGGMTFSGSVRPIHDLPTLMPMLARRLAHTVAKIRRFMGTDQEVEFTVDRGVLSILQTRRAEARFDLSTERFLEPGEPVTRGLGVRGGGFRGLAAFDEADLRELAAVDLRERDDVDGVLLVIENPTPDDIPLIISADGLLTARGGSTSHAAVAINGIEDRKYSGVMSAAHLRVHAAQHEAVILDRERGAAYRIRTGDIVSIHGTTGEVYLGSRRRQLTEA
jgi:pyruvate,orthophosphate dikinase